MSGHAQLLVIAAVTCFVLGAVCWQALSEWLDRRARRELDEWGQEWERRYGR